MRHRSELRSPSDSSNVYAALAQLARRSSDGALATDALVGLLAVFGLVLAPADWRPYLLPLVAVGAFGLWGIAEREYPSAAIATGVDAAGKPTAVRVVQWLAVAVGTVSTVIASFALLGALFGPVIS